MAETFFIHFSPRVFLNKLNFPIFEEKYFTFIKQKYFNWLCTREQEDRGIERVNMFINVYSHRSHLSLLTTAKKVSKHKTNFHFYGYEKIEWKKEA